MIYNVDILKVVAQEGFFCTSLNFQTSHCLATAKTLRK